MFVDASAIVAIMMEEPGSRQLAERLESAAQPMTSPIAIFEAVLAIRRILQVTVEIASDRVDDFLAITGTRSISVTPDIAALALDAFARYGKGQGYPAQLNMGDRFAYAVAKKQDAPLLFKGDDFGKTDIRTVGAF